MRRAALALAAATLLLALSAVVLALVDGVPVPLLLLSPDAVVGLLMPVVAGLVLHRSPRHLVGWVLLGAGLSSATYGAAVAATELLERGPVAQAGQWLTWWVWYPSLALLSTVLLLVLPDGRLPSRRWRPVLWAALTLLVVRSVLYALVPEEAEDARTPAATLERALDPALSLGWQVLAALSVVAVAWRWRFGDATTRRQLNWILLAAVLGGATAVLTGQGIVLAVLLPLALLVAVLRHGLFDVDRAVIAVVVYGALAGLLTALHAGLALVTGRAPGTLGVSVPATVLAVLLFQPMHSRLDRAARRVVLGARAAPYEVLTSVASRLSAALRTDDVPRLLGEAVEAVLGRSVRVRLAGEHEILDAESVEIRHAGETVGALEVVLRPGGELSEPDRRLLDAIAAQSGPALHNVMLQHDLERRLDQLSCQARELQSSRARLVAAQDDERRRLERDLHDGVQQRLLLLGIELGRLAAQAPAQADRLRALQERAEAVTQELRLLARGAFPPVLADLGPAAALRSSAAELPVPVHIDADGLTRHRPEIESVLYFVAMEALTNAVRHGAAARIDVVLREEHGAVVLQVRDDGAGFDPLCATSGTGLQGVRDRVGAVSGDVQVTSAPGSGSGTTVRVRVPVAVLQRRSVAAR